MSPDVMHFMSEVLTERVSQRGPFRARVDLPLEDAVDVTVWTRGRDGRAPLVASRQRLPGFPCPSWADIEAACETALHNLKGSL